MLGAVLAAGYLLRFHAPVPEWVRDAAGGAAYVIFWILAAAIVFPRASPDRLCLIVLGATCAVEALQLWHPAWLQSIRATLPGRLVLGTTFAWSDFPPYLAGAAGGRMLLAISERAWPAGWRSRA
jgi:hypothetical protein